MMPNVLERLVREVTQSARRMAVDTLPDRVVLRRRYKTIFGRPLNLRHPETFNEKLYWLVLNYRTPLVTTLADKYAVRDYVAARVGPEILNELYGHWTSAWDIDFDALPDRFVLKVNWGRGTSLLCRRKADLDLDQTRWQLNEWMCRSHYWVGREWGYKNIQPRIICERLLVDPVEITPVEYGFHCFDGEPRFVRVHRNRATDPAADIFTIDWERPPFEVNRAGGDRVVDPPPNFAEMVSYARRLAQGWPFVRVSLYGIAGRTVFSEMTLSPGAGDNRLIPESYEHYWGRELRLPSRPRRRDVPATMPRVLPEPSIRSH
jgi:teichuronopeptide biosynthesis TupA-like protein